MGLIADYVEANRERAFNGEIDPCMIVNPKHALRYSYTNLHETMREYSRSDNDEQRKKALEVDLQKRVIELESVKSHYILCEKALLEILNIGSLRSTMVLDSLKELCSQMQQAYSSVCDVLRELKDKLKGVYKYHAPSLDEESVRLRLLDLLLSGTVGFMNNDTSMDTSNFRKVVSDCATLIRILEDESYHQTDKAVVQNYMIRHFSISKGNVRCPNCKELLYTDIPYCLNCYERNGKYE